MSERTSFSSGWIWASMVLFIAVELVMGGYVAPVLSGRFISHISLLRLEVLLILGSYLAGAFLIGLMSPAVRVMEPAIGAALSAVLPFLVGVFSPVRFYHLDSDRVLLAAGLAFVLAMAGADSGERLAARLGNTASRYYAGPEE